MSPLKQNISNLPTNYSTWAAVLLAVLGYLSSTGSASFEDLVNNFSPQKLIMFLVALGAWVAARVVPQGGPPAGDPGETTPMGPP